MTNNLPDISSMGIKDLKAELLSYNLDIHTYLDKESLVNAVKKARSDELQPEHLIRPKVKDMIEEQGEIFKSPLPRSPCLCGEPLCNADQPSPMWRSGIFTGAVQLLSGEFKKVDNPRDLLLGSKGKTDWTIEENLPGHCMTIPELMSEWSHFPDPSMYLQEEKNARPIKDFLVSYRDMKEEGDEGDVYTACSKEIQEFVSSLAPKNVSMTKDEYMSAESMLTKNLNTHLEAKEGKNIDADAKVLIAYLVNGGRGISLPTQVSKQLERVQGVVKREEKEKEQFENLEKHISEDRNDDQENEKESNIAAFNNSKAAEDSAVELLDRLSTKLKDAPEEEKDEMMYPFYIFGSGEKYSNVPSPLVRAGDIVQIIANKEMKFFDFKIPEGTPVDIYVISLACFGMLTGILQTSQQKHWVYFPNHHIKKTITQGKNWH